MRLVIVESPFAGRHGATCTCADCRADVARNQRYLWAAMRDCLLRGEAPYASHGLYTQPGVLADAIPVERKLGIDAGLEWKARAHATVVYEDLGISGGMRLGIQHALTLCPPEHTVEYRKLGPGWDVVADRGDVDLPLPTGPRPDPDYLAWVLTGMPKVGRKTIDLHVFDALRAEVNALQARDHASGALATVVYDLLAIWDAATPHTPVFGDGEIAAQLRAALDAWRQG